MWLWTIVCLILMPSCITSIPYYTLVQEPLDEDERGEGKSLFKTQHSKNKNRGIHAHHFMANRWGKSGNSGQISFSWVPKSLRMVTATMKVKDVAPWKKSCDRPRQHIKKQKHQFAHKGLYSQSYGFSSSHIWMWELDHKEGWALKNLCLWTVVLEKMLESPLDSKMKSVNPKGK